MKKKILIIILTLILIAIVSLIGYFWYQKNNEKNKLSITLKDNLTVEINTETTLNDFIDNISNGELINNDKVDTSQIGEQTIIASLKNKKGNIENYEFTIHIVDTTSPVIVAKNELTTYVNKDINLLEGVSVSDNSNEEITINVEGDYSINKVGEYNLKYVATDSSNNTDTFDFTLKVINYPTITNPNPDRTFKTSKGFTGVVKNGVTTIDGVLIVNKTYSLPSNYGNGLTIETKNAFNKMQADAAALGLNLVLSSGWRSYSNQQILYNNYVNQSGKSAADTYSARPGHSEHQSGLTFDLNSINESFSYTNEGIWVHNNCYKYGFILRYPKGKDSITGYMYESWHLRYVGIELATKLYNDGDWITLEEYFGIDSKYE